MSSKMNDRLTSATMGYKPVREWAEILNISPSGLYKKLKKLQNIDTILQTPIYEKVHEANKKRQALFVYHGEERPVNEICLECGISVETFRTNIKNHSDSDEILDFYKAAKNNPNCPKQIQKYINTNETLNGSASLIKWGTRFYTKEKFCKLCKVPIARYNAVCKDPLNPTNKELREIYRTNKVKIGYQWYTEEYAAQKLGLSLKQLRLQIQQRNNRIYFHKNKAVKTLYYEGKEWTFPELEDLTGLNILTIQGRIKRGWSIERALKQPLEKKNVYPPVEINGETKSLIEWCRTLNLKSGTIYNRINRMHLTPKEALLYKGPKRKRRKK